MKNQLVDIICEKIRENKDLLKRQYNAEPNLVGTKHFYLDDVLPNDIAQEIFSSFDTKNKAWRLMDSFREKKLTSKSFDQFNPILKDMTFAVQDPKVIELISEITESENIVPDPTLYAGGLSLMERDHFLKPHIDNSHNQSQDQYRRFNILYYCSPNWVTEFGGHLELWSPKLKDKLTIENKFNRIVVMETHPKSWHSVSKINSDTPRACVSNYYFSKEAPKTGGEFHVTSFSAPPTKKLERLLLNADSGIRGMVRKIKSDGFSQKDVYKSKN